VTKPANAVTNVTLATIKIETVDNELIECQACHTTGTRTVVESHSPALGIGPYTWTRIPKDWWDLGDNETYRCGRCLHVNKQQVPWPKKVVKSPPPKNVGPSNSTPPTTKKKPSKRRQPPTGAR
jgi:hypothetical protein